MGDPPSPRSVDIQTSVHQSKQQFQESRAKTLDEGFDKSTRMESSESPIIKNLDSSISQISKACEKGETENKEDFSLSNDMRSGEKRFVGHGPINPEPKVGCKVVDCVGS